MSAATSSGPGARLAYDDPDDAHQMAENASACRAESHLARAAAALGAARRTAEAVPNAMLQAPRKVTRTALDVTDSAAKFASRLFE
jgi:hypothetical protein